MKEKIFVISSIVAVVGIGLGFHFLNMSDITADKLVPSIWSKNSDEITQERTVSFAGINAVSINTSGDIIIKQSNDKQGKLVITAKNGGVATTAVQTNSHTLSINDNSITGIVITLPNTVKTITANSLAGDINIEKTSASKLSLNSTAGDVTVKDADKNIKEMNVNTVAGDIQINVAGNQHFLIQAKSISGDVSIKDELKTATNSAGKSGVINLHSVSGDIILK